MEYEYEDDKRDVIMDINILMEAGANEAIGGMAFSYQTECPLDNIKPVGTPSVKELVSAHAIAKKDGGHNKFLESIVVWMDIRATMTWWKQFDTYRVGVTKLSKSTMHTLMTRDIRKTDFGVPIIGAWLAELNRLRYKKDFEGLINALPMGYLQTRRVCVNSRTLRNIIVQRRGHRLLEWAEFIKKMESLDVYRLLGV